MKIYVIGSINMDMVIHCNRYPNIGETVHGNSFFMNPGGKGANQAVAMSKSQSSVEMVGSVGKEFGETLIEKLREYGVNTTLINKNYNVSSGVAVIIISDNDNRIIVEPGANYQITKDDVDKVFQTATKGDYVVMQLEIPLEIVEYVLKKAKEKEIITFLNPAPTQKISNQAFQHIDYFIVNQSEAEFYTGIYPQDVDEAILVSKKLKHLGVNKVLVTLGEIGSVYYEDDVIYQTAYKVEVVDTTAAGDTYIGAFVSQISDGIEVKEAMDYASRAAAICISRQGAQQSIPTKEEIKMFRGNEK